MTMNRFAPVLFFLAVIFFLSNFASQACLFAKNPNFAEHPITVEYDVDPTWPKWGKDLDSSSSVAGISLDSHEHVWLVTRGKDPVQVYKTDGAFVRSWGQGIFEKPHNIRIDDHGNIWIADIGLHIVQKFTPAGRLLMTLGVRGEQGEDETHFNMPTDMAITPSGDIFITDGYGNRRIVHFDKNGKFIKTWGQYGTQSGNFVLPHAIVLDSKGLLYVADRNCGRIQIFNQQGEQVDQWAGLLMPWGLSVIQSDQFWICGSSPHWWNRNDIAPEFKDQLFMRFSTDGRLRQMWRIPLGDRQGTVPGETVGVHCIAQDSQGNIYLGDIYGKRAQKFTPITKR